MHGEKGIIFAADILDKSHLLSIIEDVSRYVSAIKIGNLLLYEYGWDIIKLIKHKSDLPIIADVKFMDIPEMADRVAKSAINAGVDALMVCGTAGGDTLSAFMNYRDNLMTFVFTEFTHCSGLIDKEMADDYIDMAISMGCDGVQVPGTKEGRIQEVRKAVGNDMIIICCGVGTQSYCGASHATPNFGSAILAGADYEIIGRGIYAPRTEGLSPKDAAMQARDSIAKAIRD